MSVFSFNELQQADLVVDALYKGGNTGNISDDPISKVIPRIGNQGGFRKRTHRDTGQDFLCVLYSSAKDPDWPDTLNLSTGLFVYYGDNKKPGRQLEETRPGGNRLLRAAFEKTHGTKTERITVPPFFIFTKALEGRDVIFRGLAVPSGKNISQNEDLVAIWKIKDGQRFQNYKATFTILDVPVISRDWIADLENGNVLSINCPNAYRLWVEKRKYSPLIAIPTRKYRSKNEQLPINQEGKDLIQMIYRFFQKNSYGFEKCATDIVHMMDSNVLEIINTQASVDGGRDGIGVYQLGTVHDSIRFDFSLEAKCYALDNPVGVKGLSRLISRLKQRQFGILVTTSYLGEQAYKELRDDGHPVVVLASVDIVHILTTHGLGNPQDLEKWLIENYQ